eukprot:5922552-Ditylum_brightwellii.AAC.1
MSDEQCKLFNPTVLDTVLGYIMKDLQGGRTRQRLPQWRLNICCSNIQAYSCWLNSEKQMKKRGKKEERKKYTEAEQLVQKEEREWQAEAKKMEGMEQATRMMADIERLGIQCISKFTGPDLKSLIHHYFDSNGYKDENNKDKLKAGMVKAAVNLYNKYREQTQ